jgi:hypothetical protein
MSIDSLDDVRPGDIMIADQNSAPAKGLVDLGQWLLHDTFMIGEFAAGHAAVIVPGNKLVEAMPHGARERDLRNSDWGPHTAFLRLPEDYPGQALDAAALAQLMVGTPYSIASYVYLAAYIRGLKVKALENRINRRREPTRLVFPSYRGAGYEELVELPVEAICSVLAEQAWTLTGKKVIAGTKPQVVTPGMLTGKLWNRPEVIKGAAWFDKN